MAAREPVLKVEAERLRPWIARRASGECASMCCIPLQVGKRVRDRGWQCR